MTYLQRKGTAAELRVSLGLLMFIVAVNNHVTGSYQTGNVGPSRALQL